MPRPEYGFRSRNGWRLALLLLTAPAMLLSVEAARADEDCPDAWITAKVKAKLLAKHGMDALEVNVETDRCVVTLVGCAPSPRFAEDALRLARKTKGVREVDSAMEPCPAEPEEKGKENGDGVDDCPDALLTAQVKTMLMATTGLTAFDINVETEKCVVTLVGCVDTEAQREKAVRKASKAKGVDDVRSELELCGDD